MKKIINGKKYDTETATQMGKWWNGYSRSDFCFCAETLYRKRTGEFFLFGDGGAKTRWAQADGDGLCGGEGIKPLTEAEAREWTERHMGADEYESIFGVVEE